MGRNDVIETRVVRKGPISYVIEMVDDLEPDLSWLGEPFRGGGRPDYPYFDRWAGCLVVGLKYEPWPKWELCEITKPEGFDERYVQVIDGHRVVRAEDLRPVEDSQQWLGWDMFRPGTDALDIAGTMLAGRTPSKDRTYVVVNANEDIDVPVYEAWENGERKIHRFTVGKGRKKREIESEYYEPRRVTDYNPDSDQYSGDTRECRYLYKFQNDPTTVALDHKDRLEMIRACLQDAQRLEEYPDKWSMVGMRCRAKIGKVDPKTGLGGTELDDESIWGIENDSDDEYVWGEIVNELIGQLDHERLLGQLKAETAQAARHAKELSDHLAAMKRRSKQKPKSRKA